MTSSLVDPLSPAAPWSNDERGTDAHPEPANSWLRLEVLLAVAVTVVIAARVVILPQLLLTAGDVLVLALAPLWFPVTGRYVGARLVIGLGLLAIVTGAVLTSFSADDHETRTGAALLAATLLFGMVASFGFLLWAREKVGDAALAIAFGFGLLLAVLLRTNSLFWTNPWKFGISVAVTVLLLGFCAKLRSRWLSLVLTVFLALVSALLDSRSSFALLLLTAALLTWQLRPLLSTRRDSAVRGILGLGIVATVVYTFGQTLIVNGYLGVLTQARSVRQVNETGSLILGGRPELAATVALMRDHPMGFGIGTLPNHHDITVAKTGMANINYDPNNGYVEKYMFGNGYSLHSVFGDLWAHSGLAGLALVATVMVLIVLGVSRRLSVNGASALLLFVAVKTLWNLLFGPFYSSISILELALALILLPRKRSAPD